MFHLLVVTWSPLTDKSRRLFTCSLCCLRDSHMSELSFVKQAFHLHTELTQAKLDKARWLAQVSSSCHVIMLNQ